MFGEYYVLEAPTLQAHLHWVAVVKVVAGLGVGLFEASVRFDSSVAEGWSFEMRRFLQKASTKKRFVLIVMEIILVNSKRDPTWLYCWFHANCWISISSCWFLSWSNIVSWFFGESFFWSANFTTKPFVAPCQWNQNDVLWLQFKLPLRRLVHGTHWSQQPHHLYVRSERIHNLYSRHHFRVKLSLPYQNDQEDSTYSILTVWCRIDQRFCAILPL